MSRCHLELVRLAPKLRLLAERIIHGSLVIIVKAKHKSLTTTLLLAFLYRRWWLILILNLVLILNLFLILLKVKLWGILGRLYEELVILQLHSHIVWCRGLIHLSSGTVFAWKNFLVTSHLSGPWDLILFSLNHITGTLVIKLINLIFILWM